MTYLLDVNALLALIVTDHTLNSRMTGWAHQRARYNEADFATCAVTELGFVRILTLSGAYGRTVTEAQAALRRAKASSSYRFTFIADASPAEDLPRWVLRSAQVTDGHLFQLARQHGATLATLDTGIPGAAV